MPWTTDAPIGVRVMTSTPAATTTSYAPAMTPCAREVHRLLARTALAVDGGRRDRLGPTGGEHGVAADVERLLTDLHDAAHDDVVDDRGVEVVALLRAP